MEGLSFLSTLKSHFLSAVEPVMGISCSQTSIICDQTKLTTDFYNNGCHLLLEECNFLPIIFRFITPFHNTNIWYLIQL